MTGLDLAPIKARRDATIKAPWQLSTGPGGYPQQIVANNDGLVLIAETYTDPGHEPADAIFIVHARRDVDDLLAEVKTLREVSADQVEAAARALAARMRDEVAFQPDHYDGITRAGYTEDYYRGIARLMLTAARGA